EFCAPEDTLSPVLQDIARKHSADFSGVLRSGGYVMIRGPFFEGRKYDKKFLASTGAKAVGMSVLPEACICALYEGVEVLGLAFITNDDSETHSHEANLEAAHIASFGLSQFLTGVIGSL
ncbi:MAG TPA: hypothetical protein VD998_00335, partial [Verrucomicrobiae bacterium]|nr:hypothetical protein [Verrucomicrobiae bacterium]